MYKIKMQSVFFCSECCAQNTDKGLGFQWRSRNINPSLSKIKRKNSWKKSCIVFFHPELTYLSSIMKIVRIHILYANFMLDRVPYTFMALVAARYEGLFTQGSHISRGRCPREIWLLRVNKASHLPTTRVINCLLHRNYTHNKTFFLN
jgi:hypothetical protein